MDIPKLVYIPKNQYNSYISHYDGLIIVFNYCLNTPLKTPILDTYSKTIKVQFEIDASIGNTISIIHADLAPGKRIILAPVKSKFDDIDDVRIYGELGKEVIKRAVMAGITKPIIYFATEPKNKDGSLNNDFINFKQVTLLGALSGLYIPLEAREFLNKKSDIIEIGVMSENENDDINEELNIVKAYQEGRQLAQDIGCTSPERGNPLQCAEIIQEAFKGTKVNIEIIKDYNIIEKEYPLMAAVGRSSVCVPKHAPCVVKLIYKSPDQSQVKD
eukprot:jgi/Orpsp1_1/1189568/evm.model.d7180000072927.1